MSHPKLMNASRFDSKDAGRVDVFAEGKTLCVMCDHFGFHFTREEALLLVEAITARLAEVTEGQ